MVQSNTLFDFSEPLWEWALSAAGVLLGTWLLTGWVFRYVRAKNILDHPNWRSAHACPTHRGGGLAIVVTSLSAVVIGVAAGWVSTPVCLALCVGGGLVAWVGWQDDKKHVSPRWRMVTHVVAAMFAVYVLGGLPVVTVGSTAFRLGPAGFVIGVLGVVWAINFYNFMDGIDGIASVEGALVGLFAAAILLVRGTSALVFPSFAIAAACLGFLPWNWSPAKIFMGDVGSGFLGYWFAILAISSENTGGPPVLAWVLLLGVFVFDATVTLLIRLFRGERLYDAHQSHAYQRAVKIGLSHSRVTLIVGMTTVGLGCLTWWAMARRYSLATPALLVALGMSVEYGICLWIENSKRTYRHNSREPSS